MLKRTKGFALYEAVIAIAIATSLYMTSLYGYRLYLSKEHRAEVITEIAQLRHALSLYYRVNCSLAVFIQPSYTILIDNGYITDYFGQSNVLGSDYAFNINNTFSPPSIRITMDLNTALDPDYYSTSLDATGRSGQTLFWQTPVERKIETTSRSYELFKNFYNDTPTSSCI
ncbi:MAG: hypothetical protein ACJAS1_002486 [Oleiphilaceae bacterium]|jgi:hypothetical protein